MTDILRADFETRSIIDLPKTGVNIYADHPYTDAWCMAYAFNDEPVKIWIKGEPLPARIEAHIIDGGLFGAWNAHFELAIWNKIMVVRYGWPPLDVRQCRCSMMMSAAMSLPAGLDKSTQALNLKITKDMAGHRLMMQMSRPRRINEDGTPVWWDDDGRKNRLYEYCKTDVEAERAAASKLRPLRASEADLYVLDYEINQRGVPVDLLNTRKLIKWCGNQRNDLDKQMRKITKSKVNSCSDLVGLKAFAGVSSVAKASLEKAIASNKGRIQEALMLRRDYAKTSTKKLEAFDRGTMDDGFMRGILQFYGAESTGRWSGRRVQPQNFPRPECDQDEIERRINEFDFKSLAEVSDCLRGMIAAPEGEELVCSDFNSVEARGLAWMAGQQNVLKAFIDGKDLYKVAAMDIYGADYDDVTKDQRQVGKVACIAEGELVLTDHGLCPIEKVRSCARVWDGVEWVKHDGPIFKGVRDVITYQNLTATKDHAVWTASGRQALFDECARNEIPLAETGNGGLAIRLGESDIPISDEEKRVPASTCPVCGLLRGEMDKFIQPVEEQNQRVPELLPAEAHPQMVGSPSNGGEEAMHQPRGPFVEELRGAGDQVQVLVGVGSGAVDTGEPWPSPGLGDRQDQQQQALRAGEPALGDTRTANAEHPKINITEQLGVQTERVALREKHRSAEVEKRVDPQANTRPSRTGSGGKAQKVAGHPRTSRVYDLLNCGPRHRFTVSGVLVHNCLALGYQGAKGAFNAMAVGYGVQLKDDQVEKIVENWRKANTHIVNWWYDLERGATKAINNPGTKVSVDRTILTHKRGHLWLKLPSGRLLCFPRCKMAPVTKPWGGRQMSITYMGENSFTHKVERLSTYGGKIAENIVQALCRDLLAEALIRVEAAGYRVVMHIHDEIVAYLHDGGSLEEFENIMAEVPEWAEGMPIAAEGWTGRRYRK